MERGGERGVAAHEVVFVVERNGAFGGVTSKAVAPSQTGLPDCVRREIRVLPLAVEPQESFELNLVLNGEVVFFLDELAELVGDDGRVSDEGRVGRENGWVVVVLLLL